MRLAFLDILAIANMNLIRILVIIEASEQKVGSGRVTEADIPFSEIKWRQSGLFPVSYSSIFRRAKEANVFHVTYLLCPFTELSFLCFLFLLSTSKDCFMGVGQSLISDDAPLMHHPLICSSLFPLAGSSTNLSDFQILFIIGEVLVSIFTSQRISVIFSALE